LRRAVQTSAPTRGFEVTVEVRFSSRRAPIEIGDRYAAVSAPGLAFGEELDRMTEVADALSRELR
jgi:hypothetical protein